jgi:methylthioribulose-1-phosphate dehydratase
MTPENQLAQIGRLFAKHKWSLATSSNYSFRRGPSEILITRSGIDKGLMLGEDLMDIDIDGRSTRPDLPKSSAETLVHTTIYKHFPTAQCVLHTHSVFGTRLSLKYLAQGFLKFSGYEMLKGLAGNTTHEMTEILPILPNEQDMEKFSAALPNVFKDHPKLHGFLIAGHGLYTWGDSIAEAKRHIECFEFLFECKAYEDLGL